MKAAKIIIIKNKGSSQTQAPTTTQPFYGVLFVDIQMFTEYHINLVNRTPS